MPRIRKVITGKLNSDASNDLMPQGDYVDALNVNVDADGVTSLLGNRKFKDGYMAEGYWYAGGYYDKLRRRVYCFLAHQNQKHRWVAVHVDAPAVVTLFENITDSGTTDILGWNMPSTFDASKVVKSIRVVHRDIGGDLVYFIDPAGKMLKFNYDKFFFGEYGSDLRLEYFKVYVAPPVVVPVCQYADEAGRSINNLKKKLFQFRYRYVMDDDEKTVYSAASKVPLPPKNNDDNYYADGTKANVIKVNINTGIKRVKKIEVVARVSVNNTWSDYFLVDTIDKDALSIENELNYEYKFFNDGAYNAVDVEESNLLFDYVPDKANCLEVANGNVLVPAGITEGLDKEVELDVSANVTFDNAVAPPTIVVSSYQAQSSIWFTVFSGTPTAGEIIELVVVQSNGNVETNTYTVLGGDTIEDVVDALMPLISLTNFTISKDGTDKIKYTPVTLPGVTILSITANVTGVSAGTSDSTSVQKWKGRYGYGIHYLSGEYKSRGAYVPSNDSWTVDIGAYQENSGDPISAKVTLSINNAPPSWATKYQIVRTKELTALKSKFIITAGCGEIGDYYFLKIDNLETHTTDFSGTQNNLNYEFAAGDRVRILKNQTSGAVLDSYDFEILGVAENPSPLTGTFLKIAKASVTSGYGLATTSNKYLIEIYTPAPTLSATENVYYEIGEQYDIYIDSNGNRSHMGSAQNQIRGAGAQAAQIEITEGDYYFRQRKLTTGASGTLTTYFCMDMNFSDFWQSAVWGQGRPVVVDENIKQQYYPGLMRHSLQYIHGTNINKLSRFYPDNFEEVDISYGDILNMKTRENFIRVFQRNKTGMVPVLRQIYFDNANNNTVATSERILNKINYYAGDYGIDKYGLSLVSTDFGDYFIDDINRALVRASIDGITNVSDTFDMSKFFNSNVDNGYTALGAFDYEKRDVVMGIINEDNVMQKIVRFSERRKGFQPRMSFIDAQGFLFIDGYLWTFKGVPYVHDSEARCTFYGVETAPFITVVFNGSVDFKKTFTNVSTISNRKWGCTAISTSTGQASNLKIEDFKQKEDGYDAAFLRDSNSPKGLLNGDTLKGNWIEVKFEGGANSSLDATPRDEISVATNYELTLCAVDFIESNLNKR